MSASQCSIHYTLYATFSLTEPFQYAGGLHATRCKDSCACVLHVALLRSGHKGCNAQIAARLGISCEISSIHQHFALRAANRTNSPEGSGAPPTLDTRALLCAVSINDVLSEVFRTTSSASKSEPLTFEIFKQAIMLFLDQRRRANYFEQWKECTVLEHIASPVLQPSSKVVRLTLFFGRWSESPYSPISSSSAGHSLVVLEIKMKATA